MVKFKEHGVNYVGTPFGVIYAPQGTSIEDLIGWKTIVMGLNAWEKDPTIPPNSVEFEVTTSDLGVYIENTCIAIQVNGFMYSPDEVPEQN